MDESSVHQQGAARRARAAQSVVLSHTYGREALQLRRGHGRDEGFSLPRGRSVWLPTRGIQGIEGRTLHELGEQGGEGACAVEDVQTQDPPVEQEERPELGRDRGECLAVPIQARPMVGIECRGGVGVGRHPHAHGLGRDIGPHLPLVAAPRSLGAQGVAHLGGLAGPARRIVGAPGAREPGGVRTPASGLHTGDGDQDGLERRGQHRQVEDAVLLGAHELLAIEQQDRAGAPVDETQLRHAARLGDLGHLGASLGEGLVEEQIGRLGDPVAEERKEGEAPVGLGRAQLELRQTLGDGGHGGLQGRGNGLTPRVCARRWLTG